MRIKRKANFILFLLLAAGLVALLFSCQAARSPMISPSISPPQGSVSKPTNTPTPTGGQATPTVAMKTVTLTAAELKTGYLVLVNAEYPLPKGYQADHLVNLFQTRPANLISLRDSTLLGNDTAFAALVAMIQAAKVAGLTEFHISSAHRTLEKQQQMMDYWIEFYDQQPGVTLEEARQMAALQAAKPGQSEHHTGLAFDMGVVDQSVTFGDTPQYVWTVQHCWEYGLVVRYQSDKQAITKINNEPWHLRYVGLPHALLMLQKNYCLEEYLAWVQQEQSLQYQLEGKQWEIRYVPATGDRTVLEVPQNAEISGDGIGGFIVTWQVE